MTPGPARWEELLRSADHGVLATRHPERGVDAVPACFVVDGELLAVPVDRVKRKRSGTLQRALNLAGDPRAVMLCEQWDRDDWSRLWWVRASLTRRDVAEERRVALAVLLRGKYLQYRRATFTEVLVFEVTGLRGWEAADTGPADSPE